MRQTVLPRRFGAPRSVHTVLDTALRRPLPMPTAFQRPRAHAHSISMRQTVLPRRCGALRSVDPALRRPLPMPTAFLAPLNLLIQCSDALKGDPAPSPRTSSPHRRHLPTLSLQQKLQFPLRHALAPPPLNLLNAIPWHLGALQRDPLVPQPPQTCFYVASPGLQA